MAGWIIMVYYASLTCESNLRIVLSLWGWSMGILGACGFLLLESVYGSRDTDSEYRSMSFKIPRML